MFKVGTVQPLERNQVDKIFNELMLSSSGAIDNASAAQIGKLKGADALMLGDISVMSGNVVINARIVSTETGAVLSSANIKIKKNADIDRMMANMKNFPSAQKRSGGSQSPAAAVNGKTIQWNGFTIELVGASHNGNNVDFIFMVTNNDSSRRKFEFAGRQSRGYDAQGGEYFNTWGGANSELPSGIAVKFTLTICDVPSATAAMKLLEITVYSDQKKATIPIRDIAIGDTF